MKSTDKLNGWCTWTQPQMSYCGPIPITIFKEKSQKISTKRFTVIKILVSTIFYCQNAIFLQKNFTKIWLNVWLKYFCVFIQIFCRQIGNFLSLRNIFENQCKIFASFLNYFVSAFNTIADTGWIHCIVFQYKIFAYDEPKLHKYARYFKKDAKLLQ